MARCKQSSTRPPNCNFLCLILVTERKKYIYSTNIFFLHSSPFYFFEKVLKRIPSPLIPSYLSLFLERSVVSKDRRRSNCGRWKKISIFLLARSTVSLQLKFSSCLNYYLYSSANANLLLSFVLFNFLSFPSIHLLQKIYYDSIIHPGDIKLDGIFENNQSSR